MAKKGFKFDIGQTISAELSGETGKVIGRAEYSQGENNYLVRYLAADGRQVEDWWHESAARAAK